MSFLRRWWPALVWAVVISGFSTGAFTAENTSRVIIPVLHWLLPHASPATLYYLHHIIRKCAHFTEYFILSLLILRGIQAGRREDHLRWALVVIIVVAAYACLDEYHQSFVPGRTPAIHDVLIDTCGGIAAQVVAGLLAFWTQLREQRRETATIATPPESR
jgi:VanZ family protein